MSHLVVKLLFQLSDQFLLRLQPVTDRLPGQPARLPAGEVRLQPGEVGLQGTDVLA